MRGGTTFHFVTDGAEAALERALDAAGGKDVSVGGGAETAQQYLRAGLVDEMEIHVVPSLLGGGSRLFENLDGGASGSGASAWSAHRPSPTTPTSAQTWGSEIGGRHAILGRTAMVTVDDVRTFVTTLPRATEAFVHGRVKFRVGRIVFVSFSRDETLMGFGSRSGWNAADLWFPPIPVTA